MSYAPPCVVMLHLVIGLVLVVCGPNHAAVCGMGYVRCCVFQPSCALWPVAYVPVVRVCDSQLRQRPSYPSISKTPNIPDLRFSSWLCLIAPTPPVCECYDASLVSCMWAVPARSRRISYKCHARHNTKNIEIKRVCLISSFEWPSDTPRCAQ